MSKKQDKSPKKEVDQPGYEAGHVESEFDQAAIAGDTRPSIDQEVAKAASEEMELRGIKELAENPDSWPLQADRLAIHEPLIDCLRLLAGFYGRRTSNAGLTSGLPIPPTGVTPEIMIRASSRADMNTSLTERSLESLAIAPNLPCILALAENQGCILWEIKQQKGSRSKKAALRRSLMPKRSLLCNSLKRRMRSRF